jgi:hypothetical protein
LIGERLHWYSISQEKQIGVKNEREFLLGTIRGVLSNEPKTLFFETRGKFVWKNILTSKVHKIVPKEQTIWGMGLGYGQINNFSFFNLKGQST